MSRIDWGPSMIEAQEDRVKIDSGFYNRPWRFQKIGPYSWARCEGCTAVHPGEQRDFLKTVRCEDGVLRTLCNFCRGEDK